MEHRDTRKMTSSSVQVKLDEIKNKRLTAKKLQCKQKNQRGESFAHRDVSMQNIEEKTLLKTIKVKKLNNKKLLGLKS